MLKNGVDLSFVFFGRLNFSIQVLKVLLARELSPTAIVTVPDTPVEVFARRHYIRCITPPTLQDEQFLQTLAKLDAEVFAVAGFSKIPNSVVDVSKCGALNVHPSLLPKYRGPQPEQAQILNDDRATGVTIHCIDDIFDHGPIVAQQHVTLSQWPVRADDLGKVLASTGGKLLADTLGPWVRGELSTTVQNEQNATYTSDIVAEAQGPLKLDDSWYEQWKRFCALGVDGTYYQFKAGDGIEKKVYVKSALYKNDRFIIREVLVAGDQSPVRLEEFLDTYKLVNDAQWYKYSALYNPVLLFR